MILNLSCLFAQEKSRIEFLKEKLYDGGASGYVMIFAHRGDWRNAPENSMPSYQNCIDRGIDGIEIDIQETKDGQVVIMHDATLDRTTNGSGRVSEKSLAEIKELRLKGPDGQLTEHPIPTFEEVLLASKGRILLLVDKWRPSVDKVLQIAEKHDALDHLVFRSTRTSVDVKDIFGSYLDKVHYIPVINTDGVKDGEKLQDLLGNLKTSTIGLTFDRDDHPIFDRVKSIHERGVRVWYNTLVGKNYNAGRDDEMAMRDPDGSYGWMLKKGVDAIMTDRPFLLQDYLKKQNRR